MHKHTCLNCSAVIAEGDFDCEFDQDHDFELCETCAEIAQSMETAEEIQQKLLTNPKLRAAAPKVYDCAAARSFADAYDAVTYARKAQQAAAEGRRTAARNLAEHSNRSAAMAVGYTAASDPTSLADSVWNEPEVVAARERVAK